MNADPRPLVLHVVYRFDTGGLENGIVNLVNHMPQQAYRHAIVALTEVSEFRRRIRRDDVSFVALNKPPGHAIALYPRLYRLFREMKPAIVHTRNLAALEACVPAWAARVPVRIHGEHGRDVDDLDGTSRKYRLVRRAYRPFVDHYVALSQDLAGYLAEHVGVPRHRFSQIYNGVDASRFHPAATATAIRGCPFSSSQHWIVGTVGRMQEVKDPLLLAQAFVQALQIQPGLRGRLRLAMVGDGPLRAAAQSLLVSAGVEALAWLPGERDDVPEVMRGLSCFVLPSRVEGVSNTILEAMASGLPVIATDVGGNAELVQHHRTGELVPAGDVRTLADVIVRLAGDPERARLWGDAGAAAVGRGFSLDSMVARYQTLYARCLAASGATDNRH